MKVAIYRTGKAWLTEIEGYRRYFEEIGWSVELVAPQQLPQTTPHVEWMFPGVGCKRHTPHSLLVHDYPGSTQGRFPKLKDAIKRHWNARPDLRIFLNNGVRQRVNIEDGVPWIYRPVGVDSRFFEVAQQPATKEFDFVYVGTFSGRPEAGEAIRQLARSGQNWSILVVGVNPAEGEPLPGVQYQPPIPYHQVPQQLVRARYGLVLMPNRYPYNNQEAIKYFEYAAAGLGIVSLPGLWIEQFSRERQSHYWELNHRSLTREALEEAQLLPPDVSDREWGRLLRECGVAERVEELWNQKQLKKG